MKKFTLKNYQIFFGIGFFVSVIALWLSYQEYLQTLHSISGPKDTAIFAAVISSLISISTLIGFVSTTVLAWRKDKREEKHLELDLRKKKLEIEKLEKEMQ